MNQPPYQKLNPGELQLGDIVTQGTDGLFQYEVVSLNPASVKLVVIAPDFPQHNLGKVYDNEDYNKWSWYLVERKKKRQKVYL